MEQETQEGLNIWRLAGSSILAALTAVLYFGFVITLFAGFTADIQRDSLLRELGVSSPGMLERLVLQAFHEAALREEAGTLRDDMRAIDTRSLEETRNGLALRKDAIAAWWDAFGSYSRLGATVASNRDAFAPEFAGTFLSALNAAHQFVTSQQTAMPTDGLFDPPTGMVGGGSTLGRAGSPMLDVPFGESDADRKRRADGIEIMTRLHALLDHPKFTDKAPETLMDRARQQVDAIRSSMIRFDEKNARAQIEWANIRAENQHAAKLRTSLQNELAEIEAEIRRQDEKFGQDTVSLVALFQHPVGYMLSYLIQLPTIMLTLLVTVAAGGLGAVVAFTRQNFGQPPTPKTPPDENAADHNAADHNAMDQTVPDAVPAPHDETPPRLQRWEHLGKSLKPAARLLVMTGEGIAAAMAIFLCTEAGVLMVSQGGPDGSGQIDISPFLVTFMAFVSGFMAEDAFARIQAAGQKLFRVADERDPGGGVGSG
ncbi:hypothetical protein [Thalassospira sp. ER-Se-21-Dark]|uniref:hypothetical protein n=1 Tax=Thalassospira sp. ER-Se-21-Dark TaxID=2585190 RepID=UPI001B3138B0|nr:hypothetical protein [Thalassospira sp. ER-Se-21-Dark]MBP3127849.1 hypothetical protein [Thalassospira sp. ER-Se-21-Dark]